MRPFITVIVPIYNIEQWLKQCLDSVCIQGCADIEIILVDDGSVDSSGRICDEYQKRYVNIKVIHKNNGGLVSARKAGVKKAGGEYITFVDGDDWVDTDWYMKAKCLLEKYKADILAFGYIEECSKSQRYINNKFEQGIYLGEKLEQLKRECITDSECFFIWNVLPHLWNKVIRADILRAAIDRVPNLVDFGEDAACSYPCIFSADKLYISEDTPYHYRQWAGSMVKVYKELSLEQIKGINKCLIENRHINTEIQNQIKLYIFFLLFLRGFSELKYKDMALFPFSCVQKEHRIALYGAGGFGRSLHRWIESNDSISLACWVDQRADEYQLQGDNITHISKLKNVEFDYIVIAILNEKTAISVKEKLIELGHAREKILFVSADLLKNYDLPKEIRE